jgi:hypothetical protein
LVEEENPALTGQPPNPIYFKFSILEWVKRVGNAEGSVGKVLLGCS